MRKQAESRRKAQGRIHRLKQQRRKLAKATTIPEKILRGSLVERHIECGRPNCRCHRTGGHGPYLYLSQAVKGKHTSTLLHENLKKEVRTYLKDYKKIKKKLYRLSEINTELLKLGGSNSGEGK